MKARSSQVLQQLLSYALSKLKFEGCDENLKSELFEKIRIFSCNLLRRWRSCNRTMSRFLEKYSEWLDVELSVPIPTEESCQGEASGAVRGRPRKLFSSSSVKTKKRKVENLSKSCSSQELALATQMSLTYEGKRNVATIIQESVSKSPRSVRKIKTICQQPATEPNCNTYTTEEALALLVDLKLTKHQYVALQKSAKERSANIYPPYYRLLNAKSECYPSQEALIITDSLAEVKLQCLLDHTVERLSIVQKEVLEHSFQNEEN